jgi:beta-phosphoglucomutase
MTRIRAIIWDLDGVLVDSKDWHYRALNKALALFGYDISPEKHTTAYDGLPTKVKLRKLSEQEGLPDFLHSVICNLKQRYTMQLIERDCVPDAPLLHSLSRLSHDGLRMAVASNAVRRSVDLLMDRAGLLRHMEFSLSNEDVARSKPYPDLYSKACELLQCQPAECLAVEDNVNGVQSAAAAGIHVLQVQSTDEVTYERIRAFLDRLEQGGGASDGDVCAYD